MDLKTPFPRYFHTLEEVNTGIIARKGYPAGAQG